MTPAHFAALYPDPPVVPASPEFQPILSLGLPARNFTATARAAQCPPDQIRNFINARLVLQSKQLSASAAARLCDQDDGPTSIGYGGARGGGKSFWLLAQMGADDCQRYPGLKCLLLRKVGKSNLEHFQDLRLRLFRHLPHRYRKGEVIFANGSRIIAGHYQNESDIDAYLGLEYDVIGIEEATTLTSRKYTDITTCCRTSKPGWRPRLYSTANPGGIGHAWYRSRFVVPNWHAALGHSEQRDSRFISATIRDNCFTNSGYARVLEQLNGWQRRAWYEGDWDIAAGQFFTHFRHDIHVVSNIDILGRDRWYAAMDYGFAHYTVVLLGFQDNDGNWYITDEHAQRQWLPERHAEAIRAMLRRNFLRTCDLKRFVAGPDVFSRQSNGATIAQEYTRLGFNLGRATPDRVQGWAQILRLLGDPEGGVRPKLFIHKRCQRLIQTLPDLQHDPTRPEDVLKVDCDDDGSGGDDAADALRYLVSTRLRMIYERKLTGL